MYSTHQNSYAMCTVVSTYQSSFKCDSVQYKSKFIYIVYSTHQTSYTMCTAHIIIHIHCVQYPFNLIYNVYSTHQTSETMCTAHIKLQLRNSCRCFCMEFVKILIVHRYSVDIFHILVHQEYWVLTESRIPLKLVPGDVRIIALSISSYEQTKKTKSAVFLYCRFFLFLNNPFFLCLFV